MCSPSTRSTGFRFIPRFLFGSYARLLAATIALGLGPNGIAAKDSGGRFTIQESGYWTCERVGRSSCVHWLDDDRIVFKGTRPGDFEYASGGGRTWNYAIYAWDLRTGEVSKYSKISPVSLCATNEYIRYAYRGGSRQVTLAGVFGQEVEMSSLTVQVEPGWRTDLSCGQYRPTPKEALHGLKVALAQSDGFLFLGRRLTPEDRRRSVVYYPESATSGIELPLERWQVNASEIKRIEFRRAYLLAGEQEFNRSDRCVPLGFARRVYRLTLDGTVQTIKLPAIKELRCTVERGGIHEVRAGITVQVNTGRLHDSHLYLVDQGQIQTLVQGQVPHTAVSPNGCRIAVAVSSPGDPLKPSTGEFYRGHLKVIDVCAGGGR